MHAFNYTIITYGYFNLQSWNKDHRVQNKLANPFIYNCIPKDTFLLEESHRIAKNRTKMRVFTMRE